MSFAFCRAFQSRARTFSQKYTLRIFPSECNFFSAVVEVSPAHCSVEQTTVRRSTRRLSPDLLPPANKFRADERSARASPLYLIAKYVREFACFGMCRKTQVLTTAQNFDPDTCNEVHGFPEPSWHRVQVGVGV